MRMHNREWAGASGPFVQKGKEMSNIHQQVHNLRSKPLLGLLFFVLVAVLSSSFSSWGMEGIFFAVLGAALIIGGGAIVLRVMAQQAHAMVAGKPNRMDHMLAPSGYRRRRSTETPEQWAAQSVVVATPNRPLIPEKKTNARAVTVVDSRPPAETVSTRPVNKSQYRSTCLELAKDFNPSFLQVVGRALLCLGQRGSGKSNFAALFIEQMCKLFLPAVIFDYLIDFDTLPQMLPNCRIGGHPGWTDAYKYAGNYWEVDVDNAEEVGYLIRENGGQLVIEIPSYPNNEYAGKVIVGVVRGMVAWANERDPKKRLPALVALDEAQQFLPQSQTETEMLSTFKMLNEIGRHYGLTPALFTQRAARINKDVIGGTEIYVLMRQTMPQDLKVCEDLIGKENVDRRLIASFANGDALVFEGGEAFQVHFDLRQSEHKSSMPDPEKAISFYQGRQVQKTRAFQPRLAQTSEDDEDIEDEEEDRPPVQQPAAPAPVVKQKTDMEKVLEVYRENQLLTYREMGEKVGFGKDKVGELLREARERGLIDAESK
jgi:hypothetical protein